MHFTFGSPYLWFLLLLLPCFIWCKNKQHPYYFSKIDWVKREAPLSNWELWLKLLLFTLMTFALAKPFIYDATSDKHRKGRDLVLSIDASGSMAQSGFHAKDRMKTKYEITSQLSNDFISKRFDDNMGVVVFGTFAYTASPLTYDLESLAYLLSLTNVGIAGESTAIGDAIMQSIRTLSYGEAKQKVIILLTDGYHNAGKIAPKTAVEKAKSLGIKIYTIGIGKRSDYDLPLLEMIAEETGGKNYAATSAEELSEVYKELNKLEPSAIRSENYLQQQLLILYPLGFAFVLLLLWVLLTYREQS
ncbi:MAG: hypothetical protein RL113_92 [Pseudomonadota bacterium]